MRSCMSAAFDWTERALKQPNVIESFNGDKPDAAECMLMKVDDDDDGPAFDSTPAISL